MPRPAFSQGADPAGSQSEQQSEAKASEPKKYGDESSTYWTPGWNFARYSQASTDELLALSPDELEKMQAGLCEVLGEDGMAELGNYLFEQEQQQSNRESAGETPAPASQADATTIEAELAAIPPNWLRQWQKRYRHGGGEWGFVAMRTACYGDESEQERWLAFKERFRQVVEIPFERDRDKAGAAEAAERFRIRWVEDPGLRDADARSLQEKYRALQPELPAGLSQPAFLCASADVVESFLSATSLESPPTATSKRWRPSAPYILVVAASTDASKQGPEQEHTWLCEVFKAAAEVLADELWWVLDSDIMPLRHITRGLRDASGQLSGESSDRRGDELEDIWWSTAPSPARMRQKRIRLE